MIFRYANDSETLAAYRSGYMFEYFIDIQKFSK